VYCRKQNVCLIIIIFAAKDIHSNLIQVFSQSKIERIKLSNLENGSTTRLDQALIMCFQITLGSYCEWTHEYLVLRMVPISKTVYILKGPGTRDFCRYNRLKVVPYDRYQWVPPAQGVEKNWTVPLILHCIWSYTTFMYI